MLAAVDLGTGDVPETKRGRERRIREAVEAVAGQLGNTPAVSRSSYIDPRVLDRYRNGGRRIDVPKNWEVGSSPKLRSRIEKCVRDLIERR